MQVASLFGDCLGYHLPSLGREISNRMRDVNVDSYISEVLRTKDRITSRTVWSFLC